MLTLYRDVRTKTSVMGRLYLNGAFVCYTLENADKLIPCGTYKVANSMSPKFKRELPLLYSSKVSASRGVRIHAGKTYKDSLACILVGMERKDYAVNNADDVSISESRLAETMVTMICRNTDKLAIVEETA